MYDMHFLFLYPFLGKEGKNMTICRTCSVRMKQIMSFSKDKREKFCRCPKCYEDTKHRKLTDDDLNFGEVLNKEIYKRK